MEHLSFQTGNQVKVISLDETVLEVEPNLSKDTRRVGGEPRYLLSRLMKGWMLHSAEEWGEQVRDGKLPSLPLNFNFHRNK